MDYDVLRTSIATAYKNYKVNDNKFNESMASFYKEGKQNPTVARILLKDHVVKEQHAASRMLAEVAAMPDPCLIDLQSRTSLYGLSLQNAMRSIEANDIYKATQNSNNELVNKYRLEFDESMKTNYPRTYDIRNRLIEANRLSTDKVTPKASWYDKINFVKTTEEYRKIYPKTFYTRYLLITNNHIKESEVTSRLKGIFKRFYYKHFIKNGFCFKK